MKDVLEHAQRMAAHYWIIGRAHYLTCDRYAKRHRWFGYPAAVISGAVGATLVTTFRNNPDPHLQLVAGLVSILGGLLSTLQTFHNYSNLTERHKTAAGKYMSIRRRLELLLVRYGPMDASFREQALKELESINQELDDLSTTLLAKD